MAFLQQNFLTIAVLCIIAVAAYADSASQSAGVQATAPEDNVVGVVPLDNLVEDLDDSDEMIDEEKRNMPGVMRFGKRGDSMPGVLRFGKRNMPGVMRFGKKAMPGVMRFGKKAMPGVMRFGKRFVDDEEYSAKRKGPAPIRFG